MENYRDFITRKFAGSYSRHQPGCLVAPSGPAFLDSSPSQPSRLQPITLSREEPTTISQPITTDTSTLSTNNQNVSSNYRKVNSSRFTPLALEERPPSISQKILLEQLKSEHSSIVKKDASLYLEQTFVSSQSFSIHKDLSHPNLVSTQPTLPFPVSQTKLNARLSNNVVKVRPISHSNYHKAVSLFESLGKVIKHQLSNSQDNYLLVAFANPIDAGKVINRKALFLNDGTQLSIAYANIQSLPQFNVTVDEPSAKRVRNYPANDNDAIRFEPIKTIDYTTTSDGQLISDKDFKLRFEAPVNPPEFPKPYFNFSL